jgi:subtilisin family serine protease
MRGLLVGGAPAVKAVAMRHYVLTMIAVVSLALLAVSDAGASEVRVPGRYIVVLEDSVAHPGAVAEEQTEQRDGELGFVYRHALKGYSAELSPAGVESLRRNPRVRYVVPDYKVHAFSQTIPTGIQRASVTENPTAAIDGIDKRVNVDVAVIDSGIDSTHPDLNVYKRTNCVPASEDPEAELCVDNTGTDGAGHGTHVAGTIGAIDNGIGAVGVAPGARLWAVRVLGDEGGGYFSWAIAGVDWVTAHSSEIEVANMSFGCKGCNVPPFEEAVNASIEAGVVYVAAAGNNASNADNFIPAKYPEVLTVSALADYDGKAGAKAEPTCSDRGPDDSLANFSNYGKSIDIAAPGACIYSTLPMAGSKNGAEYGELSGTSMAAPHVAGAAALLASKTNPNSKADVQAIEQALIDEGKLNWSDTSLDVAPEPLLFAGVTGPGTEVATGSVKDVGGQVATVSGVVKPGGIDTNYRFEYGMTKSYGSSIPAVAENIGKAYKNITVSKTISGLKPQTTYHYRIVATNTGGEGAIYGADRTFTPSQWSVRTTPNPSPGQSPVLRDLSCVTTDWCMAVGNYVYSYPNSLEESSSSAPLAELWDGNSWTLGEPVNPTQLGKEGEQASLNTVSCVSPSWCMAIGFAIKDGVYSRIAEVWDGKSWSLIAAPLTTGEATELRSIECTSPAACIVVGLHRESLLKQGGLIERWNGSKWSIETPSHSEETYWQFRDIDCLSANACVAVGDAASGHAVGASWNGSSWSIESMPVTSDTSANELFGVSCATATSCTAVGSYSSTSAIDQCTEEEKWILECDYMRGTAAQWSDGKWSIEEMSRPMGSVSCTLGDGCTAVSDFGSERWNGKAWTHEETAAHESDSLAWLTSVFCENEVGCTAVGANLNTSTRAEYSYGLAPTATTEAASNTNGPTATLRGTVNAKGEDTTYQFEYGTTTSYGSVAPVPPKAIGPKTVGVKVSQSVSVQPKTTYHFRLVATNKQGTVYGNDETFTTTPEWSLQATNEPAGSKASNLLASSCTAAKDCTAVGFYKNSSETPLTLAARRNAAGEWSQQATPNPAGAKESYLEGVFCTSATLCTAVGYYKNSSGTPVTLAERWNGTEWTIQSTPNPAGATDSRLDGISCTSSSACTAVGSYVNSSGQKVTLAERWNGTEWAIQSTPNPTTNVNYLRDVSCASASECWAVGQGTYKLGEGKASVSIAVRWNGSTWTAQTLAEPSEGLAGVSCTSSSACTAVGKGLAVQRWNGSSWSKQTAATPAGGTGMTFSGVSCTSATACTAVGSYSNGHTIPLAESWNGTAWSVQEATDPVGTVTGATAGALEGVSCTSATTCTAAGTFTEPVLVKRMMVQRRGPDLPTVVTESASNVKSPRVTLNAIVNPNGEATTYQFEYGTTTSYGSVAPAAPKEMDRVEPGNVKVAELVAGLEPGTTYHFRIKASNAIGTAFGKDKTFATPEWSLQATNEPAGSKASNLLASSCTAAKDCTAVGFYKNSSETPLTLAARRNAAGEWSQQATPNPAGAKESYLEGVFCTSATLCTAVGYYKNSSGTPVTLAERWNGTEWTIQSTPNPAGATDSRLDGISCTSSSACTAVGSYVNSSGQKVTLAERWNGTEWAIQSTPNPTTNVNYLRDVSCASASECWAVGQGTYKLGEGKASVSIAVRWNGSTWTAQTLAEPSEGLAGVSCTSSSACTAVGKGLAVQRWNGSSWSKQTAATPAGGTGMTFSGVSCTSATACTAVGSYSNGHTIPLAESWNGTAWSVQEATDPVGTVTGATAGALEGVSCTSATTCTAAGTFTEPVLVKRMMVQRRL